MQVFKLYFKILKNAAPVILIYFIILSVLILFIPKSQNPETVKKTELKINVALINYDKDSVFVQNLLDYLRRYCDFTDYSGRDEELADDLFYQHVQYALTIPSHFGEDFLSGRDTGLVKETVPDSNSYILVDNAINNYLNVSRLYLNSIPEISETELVSYMKQTLNNQEKVIIKNENDVENYRFYNQYFNMASYIMLSCFFFGMGMIILTLHNTHINFRNMVTPMKPADMKIQIIGGNLIFIFAFDIFIILLGCLVSSDKTINGNVVLYWLNLLAFSISALCISHLTALLVKSRQTSDIISIVLPLGVSFISGVFIPQSMLGESILKLASFTPLYWFIKGNDTIAEIFYIDFENIKNIIWYMLIQLGFALTALSVALVINKEKRFLEN